MRKRHNRIAIWLIAVVVCSLCMIPVPAHAASTANVYVKVTQDYAKTQQVLQYVNQERAKRGLKKLKLDKKLTNSAIARAAEVSIMVPLTSPHRRPNGKLVKSINSKISYECALESEMYTAKAAVDLWMSSPSHKKGILLKSARSVGIASVTTTDGYQIWMLDFSNSRAKSVVKAKNKKTVTKKVPAKKSLLKKGYFKLQISSVKVGSKTTAKITYNGKKTYGPGLISPKSFKWSSSNTKIATVSKGGVITAKKAGTVTIKAKMKTGYKFTLTKKITVKPKALTEAEILANRQKLMDYIVKNGYQTEDNFGESCYRLDTGVFTRGGRTGWTGEGEEYIIALPDYNEIKFYRTEDITFPESDGDPQQLWEMGGYVTLDVNYLDDPFYECDITVTEGTGDDAETLEDYSLLGYLDRVRFHPDSVASAVWYDDIDGEYDDEDDCIYNANDFLSDMAWNWDDNLAGYVKGLGLNMYKLGFPAMK